MTEQEAKIEAYKTILLLLEEVNTFTFWLPLLQSKIYGLIEQEEKSTR